MSKLFAPFLPKFKHLRRHNRPASRTELAEVIKDAGERDIIDPKAMHMMRGIFDVFRLRISDIMIPRRSMQTIDVKSSVKEAMLAVTASGHSRYPISSGDKDHVIGILFVKDLLPYACGLKDEPADISGLARPVTVVPETKRVDSMLREFQSKRFHMAVVVDEFGGVCGLVTIEDILEIIVGDIRDENDGSTAVADIIKSAENTYLVRGSTPVPAFEAYFKTKLPKIEVDTMAGIVSHALGHLPSKDESIVIGRFTFQVVNSTQRQIQSLKVSINPNYVKEN